MCSSYCKIGRHSPRRHVDSDWWEWWVSSSLSPSSSSVMLWIILWCASCPCHCTAPVDSIQIIEKSASRVSPKKNYIPGVPTSQSRGANTCHGYIYAHKTNEYKHTHTHTHTHCYRLALKNKQNFLFHNRKQNFTVHEDSLRVSSKHISLSSHIDFCLSHLMPSTRTICGAHHIVWEKIPDQMVWKNLLKLARQRYPISWYLRIDHKLKHHYFPWFSCLGLHSSYSMHTTCASFQRARMRVVWCASYKYK